jgi:hypothetical protein
LDILPVLKAQPHEASRALKRSVLIAGNAGTLGEALLGRLLSAPHYAAVHAATTQPIRSTTNKLSFCLIDDLQRGGAIKHASPAIDDAVIVVGAKLSFLKRDDVFPVINEDQAIVLAEAALRAGATRLLLVAPMDAWLSATMADASIYEQLEHRLRKLNFTTTWVIRPSEHDREIHRGSLLTRLARGMLSTMSAYMIPQSMQPLRAQIVAEAASAWFASEVGGHHVRSARDLHAFAGHSTRIQQILK